jgi:osmotically-inducible protein OsmY
VPFERDARNSDAAITALIRKKISLERNLSANARNVMIITKHGRVLLRGAVITVREKQLIGDIAIGIQRRENVNNQLQAGLPPSAPTAFRLVP